MTTTHSNSVSQDGRLAEVIASYIQAVEAGETPDRDAIVAAHPEIAPQLVQFFADTDQFDRMLAPFRRSQPTPTTLFDDRSVTTPEGRAKSSPREFGDYELVEEIARGGMGIVFKARNVRVERVVALKMILAGHLATATEIRRFRVEAENVRAARPSQHCAALRGRRRTRGSAVLHHAPDRGRQPVRSGLTFSV